MTCQILLIKFLDVSAVLRACCASVHSFLVWGDPLYVRMLCPWVHQHRENWCYVLEGLARVHALVCSWGVFYARAPFCPGVFVDSEHRGRIAYTPNGVYIDRGMFTHHTCLRGHSEGRCHAVCLYTHQPVRHCYPVGVLESGLCCALLRGTRVGVVPERPCVLIMSWDMSWHTICGVAQGGPVCSSCLEWVLAHRDICLMLSSTPPVW
ncbi:hypothetical protein PAPYR_7870 [Paratrimastix pyriformis]|uniref:Uncharacterized protein n=1 Tax=Paratrimastix pyriformis TaxID=342808 RepID=A0ABQ8UF60_9EUKA|nr:hypothetical protein PAPYR_7870 [Paratrimastix pyriformis]